MKRNQGFTLIEVMIVVVIVGILTAIAIPNYSDYVIRSRIIRATTGLADMRVRMEQFFQDNRTYPATCNAAGVPLPPVTDEFVFSCPTLTAATYVLQATGQGPMNGFVYTINQSNARATTVTSVPGWAGNGTCWVIGKGGSC